MITIDGETIGGEAIAMTVITITTVTGISGIGLGVIETTIGIVIETTIEMTALDASAL